MNDIPAPKGANLSAALAAAVANCAALEKTGHNDFHNYAYATEDDILQAVEAVLADNDLVIIPECHEIFMDDYGTVNAKMSFTIVHGPSGEVQKCYWMGAGQDKDKKGNVGDKGLYIAYTGAYKTFLSKLFRLSSNDDPEANQFNGKYDQSPRGNGAGQRGQAGSSDPFAMDQRAPVGNGSIMPDTGPQDARGRDPFAMDQQSRPNPQDEYHRPLPTEDQRNHHPDPEERQPYDGGPDWPNGDRTQDDQNVAFDENGQPYDRQTGEYLDGSGDFNNAQPQDDFGGTGVGIDPFVPSDITHAQQVLEEFRLRINAAPNLPALMDIWNANQTRLSHNQTYSPNLYKAIASEFGARRTALSGQ